VTAIHHSLQPHLGRLSVLSTLRVGLLGEIIAERGGADLQAATAQHGLVTAQGGAGLMQSGPGDSVETTSAVSTRVLLLLLGLLSPVLPLQASIILEF
jgi:hypothetical protein